MWTHLVCDVEFALYFDWTTEFEIMRPATLAPPERHANAKPTSEAKIEKLEQDECFRQTNGCKELLSDLNT